MSKLTDRVKAKCKDMGLSEKHLDALIEALGEGITDDSTDEDIDKKVNLIVSIAKSSQSEATRWANKAKEKPEPTKKEEPSKGDESGKEDIPDWKKAIEEMKAEMKKAREEEAEARKKEKEAEARKAAITAAFEKYKIPEAKRKFLSNVPDDVEDIDKYIGEYAQLTMNENLPGGGGGQKKVPTEKETEEVAKGWLARLTGKSQKND